MRFFQIYYKNLTVEHLIWDLVKNIKILGWKITCLDKGKPCTSSTSNTAEFEVPYLEWAQHVRYKLHTSNYIESYNFDLPTQ